jgi:hypothetical protein
MLATERAEAPDVDFRSPLDVSFGGSKLYELGRGYRAFGPPKSGLTKGKYGSDGTRTRDLRRDRPVLALAA